LNFFAFLLSLNPPAPGKRMRVANGVARRKSRRVHLTHSTVIGRSRREAVWKALLLAFAGLIAGIVLYAPAMRGEFVLDDFELPLAAGDGPHPLAGWWTEPRPVLTLSYRLNGMLFGTAPGSYHAVNLLIHVANACLVLLVLRALLERARWSGSRLRLAALAGALVFLVHPLQTESVSYIAGRSESLASFFMLLAYAVFLYDRQGAISWRRALTVLAIFAVAVKTKENAVALAGILLLTDVMWPQPFSLNGLRRNWRLYALLLPGGLLAAGLVFRMLAHVQTAGFAVATYKWYEYAFTEARAIFVYLQLAIAPVGQALDHDFAPSRTVLEHGTAVCMLLLAGLLAAAIRWRSRYPLACFGFLMFLTWLAPTSTVVPIDDAVVERRMYLALLGLILIACEGFGRLKLSRPAAVTVIAVVVLVFGGLCQARNRWWSNPELLLAQSAEGARYNPRPLLNVAEALIRRGGCGLALPYLDRADRILPRNFFVNSTSGRALACLGRLDEALPRLQFAATLRPESEVFEWIGLVYGQLGRLDEAGANLRKAIELAPWSATAHGSLALWHESMGDLEGAARERAKATALDGNDVSARARVERIRRMRFSPGHSSL
jgi:Flp pilus assembly protein TadD